MDGTCHLHRHLGGIFGFLLYGFTADSLFFIRFFRKFECRENTVVCFRITVYIGYQLAGEFFETHRKGNSNAVTDACVSMMCARTAILGALLNVRINLTSIKDEKFVKEMSEEADMIEQTTIAEEQKILDYVKTIF